MHHSSAKLAEYNITRSDYRPCDTKIPSLCHSGVRIAGSTSGESVEKNHRDYKTLLAG